MGQIAGAKTTESGDEKTQAPSQLWAVSLGGKVKQLATNTMIVTKSSNSRFWIFKSNGVDFLISVPQVKQQAVDVKNRCKRYGHKFSVVQMA